ncbi:atp-binding cassette sub-family c [Holotrichia oblita]|uniref:Atp-binding cassette sub-family c n=1 Tax=Holotrichia oblita TaxID=644536 RepID=A0ACB9SUL4_HOLOL|nr:atp-binding cassette sub-family c [Holotrichia oblita]
MFAEEESSNEHKRRYQYLYGGALLLLTAIIVFLTHHSHLELSRAGMKARIACSTLLYRKALRLNRKSFGSNTSGQIVNLMSNDFLRFDLVAPMLHTFWIIPVQIILITYFIWEEVGISSLAGVGAMCIMTIPVQGLMGKLSTMLRNKVAARTDYRVRLMSELINGIQVIKMYVWEKPFERIVQAARQREIKMLTYTSYLRGVYNSFSVFTERTTLYFLVICYYLLGHRITASKVFSSAQFFNILQLSMAIYFPLAVQLGAEALVAVRRAEEVLMLEERQNMVQRTEGNKGIVMEKVEASWTSEQRTLKHLNITIPTGMLCAIVGPVGSGKSSILQLILGELNYEGGTVSVNGEISYASQEPWLFVSSVRQNIIYIEHYDKKRYMNIVDVCALKKDFELFPNGDKTLVGERGVSLSGGQRARINLARAIYKEADIYLLDDPLSAVDTHVANHLFDECIAGYLHGKTRILVTHQLQFLKKVDHIIVLNGGTVEGQGTFTELMNNNSPYLQFLAKKEEEIEKEKNKKADEDLFGQAHSRKPSVVSVKSVVSEAVSHMDLEKEHEEVVLSQGIIAYKRYVLAGANLFMQFLLPISLIFGQVVTSACDYWLNFWIKSSFAAPGTDYTYLYIYTGLIIGCIIFVTIRSIIYYKVCMNASQNLHDKMFSSLLQAPMRFFDTNPSGRVLNRFSRDMGAMDEILPRVGLDAISVFSVMCGILVMIAIANYYMIIATVILGGLFLVVRSWYVTTAKDIKHLEGIAKSPVLSHLSATLNGIVTIRATKSEGVLKDGFDHHQNVHTSAWYLTIVCMTAVGLWLDILCVLFLVCIVFGFVIMADYFEVSDSNVGLAVSQAMILTGMLQFGVRQSTELISQMTSVERILDYTEIKSEEDTTSDPRTSKGWPQFGRILFDHMYLRYSSNDYPVLKDLNLEIRPGEKIGIVGRTGAGKSSIISALFRLAPIEGGIFIDGIDTETIPLSKLRNKISIIPQEPVLFSASVRYNLDPFGNYRDSEIYSVLEEVELKEAVPSLDFEITAGGSNFSIGQRQLLCLARAILRNNKILILDEATANVDHRTDSFIQATIRRKFAHCTVLTVAHRLNTIMDSQRIIVMAAGRIVEFDHPYALLQNTDGFLYKMVQETGPTMTKQLIDIAAQTSAKTKL